MMNIVYRSFSIGGGRRRLSVVANALASAACIFGTSSTAAARQGGIESLGCTGCHGGGPQSTVTVKADSMAITPGQRVTLTVDITASSISRGGFYIPKPAVGAFTAGAGSKVWPSGGIGHSAPAVASGGHVVFQLFWTAPSQPLTGGVDFPVAVVAANGDGTNRGDFGSDSFLSVAYGCGAGIKYFRDNDGDGYGSVDLGWTMNCSQPPYYSLQTGDCNDNDPKVHPGSAEICDGKDNDCNGMADEGLAGVVLCEDKDGDGHGVAGGATHMGCDANLRGFGSCDGDCNDNDPMVHPGGTEICNGKDDNCNGSIDENARPTCGVGWCRRYGPSCAFPDACVPGPPRKEECNDFDDDCDGVIDNGTDLALCGESLGCRAGHCIPVDGDASAGNAAGTSGTSTTTSTSGGTGTAGGAMGAAGSGPSRPAEELGCAMGRRRPNGARAVYGLFFALGLALRRRTRRD